MALANINEQRESDLKDVIIIGGGLAGLVNACLLADAGLDVLLIEKKAYPFHKVCGEYLSNEVRPFLERMGLFPEFLEPTSINRFVLTSTNGQKAEQKLDLGAFGISRFNLDSFLYKKAIEKGAGILVGCQVAEVQFEDNQFTVQLSDGTLHRSTLVIGAHGKRSVLDKRMGRAFMEERTDWMAVKYHIHCDLPADTIALHNFAGGYCGISKIEDDKYNLCYLSRRAPLKHYGDISTMEQEVLMKNPHLKSLFTNSQFIFKKPLVINEISFSKKQTVEDHVLMSGDSAGLITPLCGNGMAMAIHSAKMLSEMIIDWFRALNPTRESLEMSYKKSWQRIFAPRLWVGRNTQYLFGQPMMSSMAVQLMRNASWLSSRIIGKTHGRPF